MRPQARRTMIVSACAIALTAVVSLVQFWPRPPTFRVALLGGRTESDGLLVSCGNLVVVAGAPGTLFGTMKTPGRRERFSYFILFKYRTPRPGDPPPGARFHCTSDGRRAEASDMLTAGRPAEASYRLELDRGRGREVSEALALGGRDWDLSAGRVFLVDLTADVPVYRQRRVDLPAIASVPATPEDVERLAKEARDGLADKDLEVRAFLK